MPNYLKTSLVSIIFVEFKITCSWNHFKFFTIKMINEEITCKNHIIGERDKKEQRANKGILNLKNEMK